MPCMVGLRDVTNVVSLYSCIDAHQGVVRWIALEISIGRATLFLLFVDIWRRMVGRQSEWLTREQKNVESILKH
jgi:hypothetical protein